MTKEEWKKCFEKELKKCSSNPNYSDFGVHAMECHDDVILCSMFYHYNGHSYTVMDKYGNDEMVDIKVGGVLRNDSIVEYRTNYGKILETTLDEKGAKKVLNYIFSVIKREMKKYCKE